MNEDEQEELYFRSYFERELISDQPFPMGFELWADKITQYKYELSLPDGTTMDANLFIDHQGVFDNGKYTQYMLNRFNEL
jgi:hypothetical protein